jgi:hypothetical protein
VAELEQPVIGDHEAGVGGDDGGLVAQRPADEQAETVGRADLPAEFVQHRPENSVRDALRVHQDSVAVEQNSVERTGVRHDRDTTGSQVSRDVTVRADPALSHQSRTRLSRHRGSTQVCTNG